MNNFLLEQQQKSERIAILTEFIHSHPEARELKRAIAVKMALQGKPYSKITKVLAMNKSCITNWKQRFESTELDGIKLGYKGANSYLTAEQRKEIMSWLREKDYCNIDEFVGYLDGN
ncbi:MAG: helix-turn-helix domain-containing protein [Rhizonema sp. PD37]|nr:helix-turn-helix domain-containing protein [Rhizonema sp. PD37]